MALPGILALIPAIGEIIGKIIPDPIKKAEIQAELMKAAMNADSELYKARGSIITAEAQGESWMQRNWRPITMLTFVFIIANNYVIVPYATAFASWAGYAMFIPVLEIPEGMWGLLQIGIGGYIASRGVEKTVSEVQKGGVPLIGSRNRPAALPAPDAVTKQDLADDREKLLAELRDAG